MNSDEESPTNDCYICKQADKTAVSRARPLQPVPFPTGPWKQIGIDIVGPIGCLPLDYCFAITAVNYFSKWP